jgi:predicted metal-dependent hydrolase
MSTAVAAAAGAAPAAATSFYTEGVPHGTPFAMLPLEHQSAFHAGIELFNAGHYWHAHEQWEQCWLTSPEPAATFYKALIQAAAALVKWQQGNLRGLQRNWAKSRARLLTLPPTFAGIDLLALRTAMDAFVLAPDQPPPQLLL